MTDGASLRLDLVAGLLDQVREIIGEASTYSMLHFAASEEGRILGAQGEEVEDLRQALARVEPLLGTALEVVSEGPDEITIRIPGFKDRVASRPIQAVLLGLLEGLLSRARHRPFEGTLNGGVPDVVVHFTPTRETRGEAA